MDATGKHRRTPCSEHGLSLWQSGSSTREPLCTLTDTMLEGNNQHTVLSTPGITHADIAGTAAQPRSCEPVVGSYAQRRELTKELPDSLGCASPAFLPQSGPFSIRSRYSHDKPRGGRTLLASSTVVSTSWR